MQPKSLNRKFADEKKTETEISNPLSKLGKEKTKNENRQAYPPADHSAEENAGCENRRSGGGGVQPHGQPPAAPCPVCGSVLAWWDVYGGGPHCHRCRPWPAEFLIRRLTGYDAQDARWRAVWPPDGSQDQDAAADATADATCDHQGLRGLIVWPPDILPFSDKHCGMAEAEFFFECKNCGLWFPEKKEERDETPRRIDT